VQCPTCNGKKNIETHKAKRGDGWYACTKKLSWWRKATERSRHSVAQIRVCFNDLIGEKNSVAWVDKTTEFRTQTKTCNKCNGKGEVQNLFYTYDDTPCFDLTQGILQAKEDLWQKIKIQDLQSELVQRERQHKLENEERKAILLQCKLDNDRLFKFVETITRQLNKSGILSDAGSDDTNSDTSSLISWASRREGELETLSMINARASAPPLQTTDRSNSKVRLNVRTECSKCAGTGNTKKDPARLPPCSDGDRCLDCHGQGKRRRQDNFYAHINGEQSR